MPLIESSTITSNTQLKPVQTETGNNSAFHAIFGLSNGEKYIYQGITQLQAKKANIANNIKSINDQHHPLFPSVTEAIVHLIKQGGVVTLDKTHYPTLLSHQEEFTKNKTEPTTIIPTMINEYALLMEQGDRQLFSPDIKVIAHAYTLTNKTGISIEFYEPGTTDKPVKTSFNPGQPHIGMLYLDKNTGNYQAVIENHGTFTSQLSRITHPKPFYLNSTGNYKASGLKLAFHGNIYQLKLLMLFALRGQKDQLSYFISTEMDNAEKFDDLVFKSKSVEQIKHTYDFLQAKHKQDATGLVTKKDLLDTKDGEFSLPKYFTSFKKIKENPAFNDGDLGNFYLCTNIDLATNTGFTFDPITDPARLLDNNIAGEVRYRIRKDPTLNKGIYESFKKNTEGYKLARKIVKCVVDGKQINLKTPLFKEHQANLANAGIIKDGEFTTNFIKGKLNSHAWINEFRKLLIEEAPDVKVKKNQDKDIKKLENLNDNMKATKGFGKKDTSPIVDLEVEITDTQIEEFLDHFVLAVKQSGEIQLGEIIARELGNAFNLMDGDFIYSELEKAMLDWMKTKDGKFITHEAINQFFVDMRIKLSRFALIGATLSYQEKLNQAGITFSNDLTVSNFLVHPTNQVLVCQTPGDAFLSTVQIYQTIKSDPTYEANDSCVFLSLEKASRIADLVKKSIIDSERLLVIVCKKAIDANDLDFIATLTDPTTLGTKQKIIVVANKDHAALLRSSSINFVPYTTTNDFDTLSAESKIMVLNKTVRFLGNDKLLKDIVDKISTVINAQTLVDIIEHPEEPIPVGDSISSPENQPYIIPRGTNRIGPEKPNARISLITAEPGMGKTTLLSHYIAEKRVKEPGLWAIKLDLSKPLIEHKLANLKSPIDKDNMIAFFIGDSPSPLARKIFEDKLENGGLIITLDSFDAITTAHKTKVIELLTLLKETL